MKRRLIVSLISLFVLFSFVFNVSALDLSTANSKYEQAAEVFAKRISKDITIFSDWKSVTLSDELYLYNETGDSIKAVLYEVYCNGVNSGYIIVDYSTINIIEFSTDASPYGTLLASYKKEKGLSRNMGEYCVYSPGVHAYAAKTSSASKYVVYNFVDDQSVSIDLSVDKSISTYSLNNTQITPLSTGVHSKILSGVPDANYTTSCIPTAIGNVIGYWDTHGYSNLIVSPNTIYNAIAEINTNLIAACGSNTNNAGIPTATQNYCRSAGRYPNNFTVTNVTNPSYSTFTTQITNNRPTLVGFASGGPYVGAHMTAGVGYYYDDAFPNEKYIYVHDAWSSTSVNYFVLWGSYNDFISKIVP